MLQINCWITCQKNNNVKGFAGRGGWFLIILTASLRNCNISADDYKQSDQQKMVKSSHLEVFCGNGFLKNFAKFTGKHLCQNPFLIKLQAWRAFLETQESLRCAAKYKFFKDQNIFLLETTAQTSPRVVTWRCSIKKILLKILQKSYENTCSGVAF